jgi:peptide methionine sulfoxide reductase msrA/msrB
MPNRHAIVSAIAALTCVGMAACRESAPTAARLLEPPAATDDHPSANLTAKESTPMPAHPYSKPPLAELKQKLTPIQFEVTQNDATEPPFRNAFYDNHEPGIYVDVATGEPLFSSLDKFESGTGWPSFTRPIEDGHVVSKSDGTLGMMRTEVRSSAGNSHLGHVFDDGPRPTGARYCINSASLRFVPAKKLVAEGYGAYAARFGVAGASPAPAEVPASTANACAAPAPGQRAGCEATLDTALLGGGREAQDALRSVAGVLEVQAGTLQHSPAVRVVFDPKKIAFVDLLRAWAPVEGASGGATLYVTSGEQRAAAAQWKAQGGAPRGEFVVRTGDPNAFALSEN